MPNKEKTEKGHQPAQKKQGKQNKRFTKPSMSKNKAQKQNEKSNQNKKQNTFKKQAQNRKNPKSKKQNYRNNKHFNKPREVKPVKIGFLGGLNEIGKNITVYEYENDIILVDCGLAFPDPDMLGVDLVIPDFSYLEKNAEKIRGIVITHGHEDHIGGLAYMIKSVNVPVYGTRLTIGLIEGKLEEHRLTGAVRLNVIQPGEVIGLGEFQVEAIHVNHSIPDSLSYAITCGAGTIIQTGDFKIDSTPIDGDMIDLNRFAELGAKEEDIPALVEKHGVGDGQTWGFVRLSAADITEILTIAAHATL